MSPMHEAELKSCTDQQQAAQLAGLCSQSCAIQQGTREPGEQEMLSVLISHFAALPKETGLLPPGTVLPPPTVTEIIS